MRREFDLSRRRSYELLDQGRVLRAVQAAAGIPGLPRVSAHAAAQIKAHLAIVTERIRAQSAGLAPTEVNDVIQAVIRDVRARPAKPGRAASREPAAFNPTLVALPERSGAQAGTAPSPARAVNADLERLLGSVESLSRMPPVPMVIAALREEHRQKLADLGTALDWLSEFASCWARGRRDDPHRRPLPVRNSAQGETVAL